MTEKIPRKMNPVRWRIGVDLDNTIIDYRQSWFKNAQKLGLPDQLSYASKNATRRFMRALPDGENKWQELQAIVYGANILDAKVASGFEDFVRMSRANGVSLSIVSHKTQVAARGGFDLHKAAMRFLHEHRFFAKSGLGFSETNIHFEETRRQKVQRIRELNCTHFIDDLQEVFDSPQFPDTIENILLTIDDSKITEPAASCRNWHEVKRKIFKDGTGRRRTH